MPVAKNYENYPQLCEPYTAHNRLYVKISINGNPVEVRFYTDEEFSEMYSVPVSPKDALGFSEGFITLFRGEVENYEAWFKKIGAKYHTIFGWYLASAEINNQDLPSGLQTYRLNWEDLLRTDGSLKSSRQMEQAIYQLIYKPSASTFVGKVGDRLILILMVKKVVPIDTRYGRSILHVMEDSSGNVFTWLTGSKSLVQGKVYKMSCVIKDHRMYKNIPQTILSRCKVVQE